jgi:hypothetical protein
VLAGGRIVAVGFSKPRGATVEIEVPPFERLSRRVRGGLESETDALSRFLGVRCDVRVATV